MLGNLLFAILNLGQKEFASFLWRFAGFLDRLWTGMRKRKQIRLDRLRETHHCCEWYETLHWTPTTLTWWIWRRSRLLNSLHLKAPIAWVRMRSWSSSCCTPKTFPLETKFGRLANGFWLKIRFSILGVLNCQRPLLISNRIIIQLDRLTGVMVQEVQQRFTGGQGREHLFLFRYLQVDALSFLFWNAIENLKIRLTFQFAHFV